MSTVRNDTENLHHSIANPRRTTLSGRTHAEVLAGEQTASSRDDDER
jgi:hypothetical protein